MAAVEKALDYTAQRSAGTARGFGCWKAGGRHMQDHCDQYATPELLGVVGIANQAARAGIGDVVWYTWAESKRVNQIGFGSFMLSLTRPGARDLLPVFAQRPYHADLVVLKALRDGRVRGSYVWPSIGQFQTHASGIIAGVRLPDWNKPFVREGVSDHPTPRWLCGCVAKGPVKWLQAISMSQADMEWTTECPPKDFAEMPPWALKLLERRNWLNRAEEKYWGPTKGKAKGKADEPFAVGDARDKGHGKGKGKGKESKKGKGGQGPSEYDRLRDEPWSLVDLAGNPQQIPLLVQEFCCDDELWDYNGPASSRLWAMRRAAQMLYRKRIIASPSADVALLVCSFSLLSLLSQ